jgi:hypothetical protein
MSKKNIIFFKKYHLYLFIRLNSLAYISIIFNILGLLS